jgi:hypothetical protein
MAGAGGGWSVDVVWFLVGEVGVGWWVDCGCGSLVLG